MQVTRAAVTDAAELERAVNAFAQQPNGALIVLPNIVTVLHRDLITDGLVQAGIPIQDAATLERDLAAAEAKLPPQQLSMLSRFQGIMMMEGDGSHPPVHSGAHPQH